MDAICYYCYKPSSDWCQDFAAIKSEHTQTPIADFIRQFLGDFHSVRSIDDESNCICAECLKQINDYDWMRQQVSKQETKLRDLLLATEIILCVKNEPVEVKVEIEDCHNEMVFADELKDSVSESEIKIEPSFDVLDTQMDEQLLAPTPIISRPSTSSSNTTSNVVTALHSNCKPTSMKKRIIVVKRLKRAVLQNAKGVPASTTTATISTGPKAIKPSRQMAAVAPVPRLSTIPSLKLNQPVELKEEIEDFHDEMVANEHSDDIDIQMHDQRPTPVQPNISMPPQQAPSTSSPLLNDSSSNIIQTPQSINKRKEIAIPKANIEKNQMFIRKNGKLYKLIEANGEELSKITEAVRQNGKGACDSTVASKTTTSTSNVKAMPYNELCLDTMNDAIDIEYVKPSLSFIGLVALALKNSRSGSLQTMEIYSFLCEHFPYFKTSIGWKSNVRSALLTNNFEKFQHQTITDGVCNTKDLWTNNPIYTIKMDELVKKWSCKPNLNIMAAPKNFAALVRGEMKHGLAYGSKPQSEYQEPNLNNASLIALALKNSWTGSLLYSEIYDFICKHFPYFRTARKSWKDGILRALRNSKYIERIEGKNKMKCLWKMEPSTSNEMYMKMQEQVHRNPMEIQNSMAVPENLPALLRGEMKHGGVNDSVSELDDEDYIETDEIDIEDSKLFQFELNAEDGQIKLQKEELHQIKKTYSI